MPKKYNYTMKTGRPSLFNEIDQDKVSKLVLSGWDDAQVADFFGFTRDTFNNWKNAHAKFFSTLKDWKREADLKVEKSLYQRALGFNYDEVTYEKSKTGGLGVKLSEGEIEQVKHVDTNKVKVVTKFVIPDVTAQIFWLKNRQPEQWRDRLDPQFYIDKSKHTHYTKINDENLIKQARKSGVDIPDSIKGRIESQSTGKRDKVLQS